jgi:cell pole-organizing protein PopZ
MSMEDILASIRKMIAQDQDSMDAARTEREAGLPSEEPAAHDEVLDLIDELPEDGVTVDEDAVVSDEPPAWDTPPEEEIAELAEHADGMLDLDTEFAIAEDVPPPVETAAGTAPTGQADFAAVEANPSATESVVVGLGIVSEAAQPEETEPEMGDIPRFLDESQQPVDETATFDEPDDTAVEPATAVSADVADRMAQTPHEEVVSMDSPKERILSPEAAVKTSAAFDQLAQTLLSGYDGEANTLEGVVRAMLKPLLREWLDANLPRMVEDAVQAEIRRLSR